MIPDAALLTLATAGHVGLRSLQQLNVVHERFLWILPTSLGIAAAEVVLIVRVAHGGGGLLATALPMAVGGAAGCALAMVAHRWARERLRRRLAELDHEWEQRS